MVNRYICFIYVLSVKGVISTVSRTSPHHHHENHPRISNHSNQPLITTLITHPAYKHLTPPQSASGLKYDWTQSASLPASTYLICSHDESHPSHSLPVISSANTRSSDHPAHGPQTPVTQRTVSHSSSYYISNKYIHIYIT